MDNRYKHNHYVPIWYQKRFIPNGYPKSHIELLDLNPPTYTDSEGKTHPHNSLRKLPMKSVFAQDDLYTTRFGAIESRDIEKIFFGDIDNHGNDALDYFANYDHTEINYDAFQRTVHYLSTQKLRTPKGLDWLSKYTKLDEQNALMSTMLELQNFFSALWTECIWQIADASSSETKFIISDHPVTVYNREIGPRNPTWSRYPNDAPIHLQGTHTFIPLSYEKILILTNKSWVWHPYQSAKNSRPNPRYLRNAIFNYTEIQVNRHLSETEVRQINFIIKSRAKRYVAAANNEWLYPERYVSKSDWNTFGDGYLFMPDPRPVHYGGEIVMGFRDGSSRAHDAYGRLPWEPEFNMDDTHRPNGRYDPLERFKSEFARRYGPTRRGIASDFGSPGETEDSPGIHDHYISRDNPNFRRFS